MTEQHENDLREVLVVVFGAVLIVRSSMTLLPSMLANDAVAMADAVLERMKEKKCS